MKKVIIALAVLLVAISGAYTLENTISIGTGDGIGIPFVSYSELFMTYDLRIAPHFSVGINMALQYCSLTQIMVSLITTNDVDFFMSHIIDAQACVYPFGGVFHIDAGLGYSYYLMNTHCMVFTPGLGWKVKIKSFPNSLSIILREEYFVEFSNEWAKLKLINLLELRIGYGFSF